MQELVLSASRAGRPRCVSKQQKSVIMNIHTRSTKDSDRVESTATEPTHGGVRWSRAALRAIARMCTTRINGPLGLAADFMVSIVLLYAAMRHNELRPAGALATVWSGLLLFSFFEYAFHRWLFHGPAQVFQQGHLIHHQQPMGYDSLPFFLAPLTILMLTYLLGQAAPTIAFLFAGSFAAGYAAYGLSHWLIHNIRFRNSLVRRWAADHHIHHFHADRNFGVTTPLWDIVLRTRYIPARTRRRPTQSPLARTNDRT